MNTIIYASVASSQEFFENHFNEVVALPGQAVQKYNRLIIEGLSKNQDILVETVTSVPVSRATNKNFFYKGKTENKNDGSRVSAPVFFIRIRNSQARYCRLKTLRLLPPAG